jgi:heptosyltransferase-2
MAEGLRQLTRTRVLYALVDAVGRPLTRAWRALVAQRGAAGEIRRVLVIEPRHIGDAIIASAALRALRAAHPLARITLLGKTHAGVLYEHSGLVDELVTFEEGFGGSDIRRRPALEQLRASLVVLRRLRSERFDLSIDSRSDLRSNLLTLLAGVRRRVGFSAPGGAYLLTDAVVFDRRESHKVDDWMALLRPLGIDVSHPRLELRVTEAERDEAAAVLAAHGVGEDDLVVGIHPGANQAVRRWDLRKYASLADEITERFGAKVVVFVSPDGYGADIPTRQPVVRVRPTLRQLMAMLSRCALMVGNDSGPMHVAVALGVPTVAVFTSQKPQWFAPYGAEHSVVIEPGFACRPCFDQCRFSEPFCNTTLPTERVVSAVEARLARVAAHV